MGVKMAFKMKFSSVELGMGIHGAYKHMYNMLYPLKHIRDTVQSNLPSLVMHGHTGFGGTCSDG